MQRTLVKIDLERLRLRLWMAQGKMHNEWELRQWLDKEGFKWRGSGWHDSESTLDALKPDEIIETQIQETANGITFVHRPDPDSPAGRPS